MSEGVVCAGVEVQEKCDQELCEQELCVQEL